MPKRPSPSQPTQLSSWDIYRAASKAKWIGSVEAADADAAIKAAAIEFKTDARRLIAVRRRAIS
jgi:hypothetical protein